MSSPSPVSSRAPAKSPERRRDSTLKRLLSVLGLIAVVVILVLFLRPSGTEGGPSNAECGQSEYGPTEEERNTLIECIRQSGGTQ